MQFKNQEILYFLFLLLIPILVHLFQLRKFKKEFFTNVRFLKELSIETRKSSKIKKYLLLTTRLLLLTFLIIAFAQPFFKASDAKNAKNELFIVLDNSYSMQAKGQKGELLKRAVQELLEQIPENTNFSLITNDENFWNCNIKTIEKDLQNLKHSALPFSLETALIQIKSRKTFDNKDIFVITDAIGLNENHLKSFAPKDKSYFVIPVAEQLKNIAIDTVYLAQTLENFYEIGVDFSSNSNDAKTLPVAVYNEKELVAKTILNAKKNKETLKFTVPKKDFHGYISITDGSLSFDNTLYFTISEPKISNILSIGNVDKNNFLSRIYTKPEFNYFNSELASLDYSKLTNQDAIVLNEIENIPVALLTNLKSFVEKGGNIVVIPSEKSEIANLNSFLSTFGNLQFSNVINSEKKVTKINFSNPLFTDVFEKKTSNFQYPTFKNTFNVKSNYPELLSFDDGSAFLTSLQNKLGVIYVFSAALNKVNSNFQNSPLIVPTFYKMGINNSKNAIKNETIGNSKPFLVSANASNNQVISIKNSTEEFIPMQQIFADKIKISCTNNPKVAGNFSLIQNNKPIEKISFNFDRKESKLQQPSDTTLKELNIVDSVEAFFDKILIERTDSQIWKWFLLFTLIFLILEIAIQKFVK